MALTTQINLTMTSNLTSALDLATAAVNMTYSKGLTFASGVAAGQADMIWHDQRTLATGANENLDLAGSLTSLLGGTLTFVRVKGVLFFAATANTTTLTVTRPTSNGVPLFSLANAGVVLTGGGLFLFTDPSAAGVVVTAGTGDLLNVANSAGASATYDVIIFGGLS